MSKLFSKDFMSELTPGKITAKLLVTGIAGLLIFGYEVISKAVLYGYKHLSQTLYDNLLQDVSKGQKDYALFVLILMYLTGVLLMWKDVMIRKIRIKRFFHEENSDEIIIREKHERIKSLSRMQKFTAILNAALIILFFGPLLTFYLEVSKNEIHRNFNQRIAIVSPYLSFHQKEKLISSFFCMKKEEDFRRINNYLDSVLQSNKLTL